MSKAIGNLWSKLWCHHSWEQHSKQTYSDRVPRNVEILICKECGKIKTIEY
jgi:Fe2+ or Zn2+ uptake regulation protein